MTLADIERLNDLLDDNECRLSHEGGHGHHEVEENAYREMWALAKQAVNSLREARTPGGHCSCGVSNVLRDLYECNPALDRHYAGCPDCGGTGRLVRLVNSSK